MLTMSRIHGSKTFGTRPGSRLGRGGRGKPAKGRHKFRPPAGNGKVKPLPWSKGRRLMSAWVSALKACRAAKANMTRSANHSSRDTRVVRYALAADELRRLTRHGLERLARDGSER